MNQQQIDTEMKEIEQLIARAIATPDKLVKLSAGNYFFFSASDEEVYIISDESYEYGGRSQWVVRNEKSNNYVNDYPSLKSFKEEWVQ
jgi:hypothetical protein